MNTWQENQLQAVQSIQSEQQLFQTIFSLGQELGFDHCTWTAHAVSSGDTQDRNIQ
jgi:hypothetical protein